MSELDPATTGTVPAPAASGQPAQPQPSLSDAARAPLDREMREAKDGVLRMGSIVELQIRKAIDALIAHDEAAATEVIVGDRRVNDVQVEDSSIITLAIATQ
ncbi:MAG: PhoU domain-containing protein, partial [Candidatus Limnocylindrales bacterium]